MGAQLRRSDAASLNHRGYTVEALALRHLCFLPFVLAAASIGCGCSPQAPAPPAGSTPEPSLESSTLDLPSVTMPAADLKRPGFAHVEVFRLRRDFGKQDFEVALDAWLPDGNPGRIETVRLWWFKTKKEGERGPFSEKTKRYFDIAYRRVDDATWEVQLLADERRFTFSVAADGKGGVQAFGSVESEGVTIDDCHVATGDLRATKLLGVPTGIKELSVTCVDSDGAEHEGRVAS